MIGHGRKGLRRAILVERYAGLTTVQRVARQAGVHVHRIKISVEYRKNLKKLVKSALSVTVKDGRDTITESDAVKGFGELMFDQLYGSGNETE